MPHLARRGVWIAAVVLGMCLFPIPAEAAPPVAESGPDVTAVAGTDAVLAGSVSDADGDALEIHWMATVVGAGDEASCSFTGPWSWAPLTPAGLAPTLNSTEPGSYLLQLVVGDGTSSDDDTGALVTFTDPDTTPASCSLTAWVKGPPKLRIGDAESGLASYAVLDTHNLDVTPLSRTFPAPVSAFQPSFSRPGSGPGVALVTHENGAGLVRECVLLVRRDGTAAVLN